MGTGAPQTFRIPLILMAMANLALLGKRLWPWQDVLNLPLNGATGIDPAIALLGYIGLLFWMGGSRVRTTRAALFSATLLGLLGGALLAAHVALEVRPGSDAMPHFRLVGWGLLAAAALVWGFAGSQGTKADGDAIMGLIAGAWSAMTSCLIAFTAVLVEMSMTAPAQVTTDPWKQYEGLAIGNTVTQSLVNSLNVGLTFLLVGPLVGLALGLIFGLMSHSESPKH